MSDLTPYYQDDFITLYNADCRELLATLEDESVQLVITDPPYTQRVHKNSRISRGDTTISVGSLFAEITDQSLSEIMSECGRVSQGWVVANMDYRHAVSYDIDPPDGLVMKRIGVWLKKNPIPQFTGDRPAQGWEAIAYMHRADRKSRWSGGGHAGNFYLPAVIGAGHPTSKPPAMIEQFVRWFSDSSNGIILDPFAGSGTTLRTAKNLGKRAVGCEVDKAYCDLIVRRLAQETLFF